MNTQKYVIASIVAAVFIFFYGYLMYGVLLVDYIASIGNPALMLPQGSENMTYIGLGCLIQAFGLGLIYVQGHEGKGAMEGVRFGLYVGIFLVGIYVLTAGTMPVSLRAAITYGIIDTVMYMGAGVCFALLYKK